MTLADIIDENSFSPTFKELGHLPNKLASLEAKKEKKNTLPNKLASLEAKKEKKKNLAKQACKSQID